jgi:hypothetical protein
VVLLIGAIFEEVGARLCEADGAVGDVVIGVRLEGVGEALRGFKAVGGESDGAACGVGEMGEEEKEEEREGRKEGGRHGVCGNVGVGVEDFFSSGCLVEDLFLYLGGGDGHDGG